MAWVALDGLWGSLPTQIQVPSSCIKPPSVLKDFSCVQHFSVFIFLYSLLYKIHQDIPNIHKLSIKASEILCCLFQATESSQLAILVWFLWNSSSVLRYWLCSIDNMGYYQVSNIEHIFSCGNFHPYVSFPKSFQSNQCLGWCRLRNYAFYGSLLAIIW